MKLQEVIGTEEAVLSHSLLLEEGFFAAAEAVEKALAATLLPEDPDELDAWLESNEHDDMVLAVDEEARDYLGDMIRRRLKAQSESIR